MRTFFFVTAGIFGIVAAVNYAVDPYRVFNTRILKHDYQVNERFAKIEFLKTSHSRFNAYILGSSRVGVTDPVMLEAYVPGSSFYNVTVSGGLLSDALLQLRYFLHHDYEIRSVYLQIDIDNVMAKNEHAVQELLFVQHPEVVNGSKFDFYAANLFAFLPVNVVTKLVRVNLLGRHEIEADIEGKGKLTIVREGSLNDTGAVSVRGLSGDCTALNLSLLRKIKTLCDSHRIQLIIFTTPLHHDICDQLMMKDYLDAIRMMASITDYWDFTGYNTITLDDRNYFDRSHYRPEVSRFIAARIFGDKTVAVPSDFGVLVTARTAGARIAELRTQFIQRDKRLTRRGFRHELL